MGSDLRLTLRIAPRPRHHSIVKAVQAAAGALCVRAELDGSMSEMSSVHGAVDTLAHLITAHVAPDGEQESA